MKKVFALFLILGAAVSVFAQSRQSRGQSRDVVLGQQNRNVYNERRYDGHLSARERDALIAQIRRDYRWRIEAVKRDRHLRNGEQRRQVRFLENERDQKIRAVWYRFNHQNTSRYGRRY